MKLIDKNGKLFGLINVIDISVIIFVLFIGLTLFFGYRTLFIPSKIKAAKEEKRVFGDVEVYCEFVDVDPQIARSIKVGDKEMDEAGRIIAEVLKIEYIAPYSYKVDLGDNVIVERQKPDRKKVWAKMRFTGDYDIDKNKGVVFKGYYNITNGNIIPFVTPHYQIKGVIRNEIEPLPKDKSLIVDVIFGDLDRTTAEKIKKGDAEVDESGKIIAELIDKGTIEPQILLVDLGGGNIITEINKNKLQLRAKLKIIGEFVGSSIFFKYRKLRYDIPLTFNTKEYSITGKIVAPGEKFESETGFVTFNVVFKELDNEAAQKIKEGDQEISEDGEVLTKIVSIECIKPSIQKIDLGGGRIVTIENHDKKDVWAKVEFFGFFKDDYFIYKGRELRQYTNIIFTTDKYQITGNISLERYQPGTPPEEQYGTVTFDILFKGLSAETAEMIKAGDAELDEDGHPIAEILEVGQVKPMVHKLDLGGGNIAEKEDSLRKEVMTKVLFRGEPTEDTLAIKGNRLRKDMPINFKTGKYNIQGQIIIPKEYGLIRCLAQFNSVENDIANQISKDDILKTENGEKIGRITEVISKNNYKYEITDLQGNRKIESDPNKKDITAEIELICELRDQSFYYGKNEIKQNCTILLATDEYALEANIKNIPTLIKNMSGEEI